MDDIPLSTLGLALAVLLVVSGFFSLAETAMMAANRYRLKHRALRGERGAKLAVALLGQTDRLLGVILLGNNLINAAAATLTTVITVRLFGEGELALGARHRRGDLRHPGVLGNHAEGHRRRARRPHRTGGELRAGADAEGDRPIVGFVNLFVQALLRLLRVQPAAEAGTALTQEELRTIVLEGQYLRGKHRAMIANLLDLENITVEDVMTPRPQIHGLDLAAKPALLTQQLATTYHTRLPAYEDRLENIVGIIHVKQVLQLQHDGEIDGDALRTILRPPYFVPAGTPLLTQLQHFQTDRQRLGLVVDEYGELTGLVTIEDIIEEIIGEFTTQAPDGPGRSPGRPTAASSSTA